MRPCFEDEAYQGLKLYSGLLERKECLNVAIPMTEGTDAHIKEEHLSGIGFHKRLESIDDFMNGIKTGKGYELLGLTI
jgi:hypothetical protein